MKSNEQKIQVNICIAIIVIAWSTIIYRILASNF